MSQQEDDLRALAKIMDFLRAVSIILVVVHLYWYGYEAVRLWGIDIGVVDRVVSPHPLHQTFRVVVIGTLVPRHKGSERGKNHVGQDLGGACRRAGVVLPQLVDAIPAAARGSQRSLLRRFDGGGLCLPPDVRHMDEPPLAHQPHG